MPKLRFSHLRTLLPYAARILPVLTGVAIELPSKPGPDLTALNRHVGEMESTSRGLRSQVEGQGEQLDQIEALVNRLTETVSAMRQEQQERTRRLERSALVVKWLAAMTTILLIVLIVMCAVLLAHVPWP